MNLRILSIKVMGIVVLMAWSMTIAGQSKEEAKRVQDSTYQSNIKRTRINGVYIPKDLDDAFLELNSLSDAQSKTKFRIAQEELVAKKLHFGLGRWMEVNWSFEEGSRFSHFLTAYGLIYSDDMIDFMLRMYHRHLNGKPLKAQETAKEYIDKREKLYREELKQKYGIDSLLIKNGD